MFYDHRISEEIPVDDLGEEWKGYVFKITGGFDKGGFAMKQGVMLNHRTRLLLDGTSQQYTPKRDGARKRKSVRGCIVANDISCLNVIIVKRGPTDIPRLTDPESYRPNMRGPKRANNIRAVWGLSKDDDVRQYVAHRTIPGKDGKPDQVKAPKIQRLVTPESKAHKARRQALKKKRHEKSMAEAAEYQKLLEQKRQNEQAERLSKKKAASEREV
eukprot:TRINITY_DN1814_c0_g1_i1.p1 TRINITY_DN1814_c0_g1~~TRINITY_DN1814_c0_g1_i1.p1  ORF type:complete len:215 (-),score=49.49 TRINITY_DN1814_c0_g1_i1:102-746(-)